MQISHSQEHTLSAPCIQGSSLVMISMRAAGTMTCACPVARRSRESVHACVHACLLYAVTTNSVTFKAGQRSGLYKCYDHLQVGSPVSQSPVSQPVLPWLQVFWMGCMQFCYEQLHAQG